MPDAHDDELLQALACGDLDATDPAIAARLAADPHLARRWRELAATMAGLHELDDIGRELQLATDAPRLDARAAIAAGRAAMTGRTRPAAPRRAWSWPLAAAAAALLVALAVWQPWRASATDPDPRLGDPTFVLTPADAMLAADQPLTWVAPRGSACYRVVIEDPTQPATSLRSGLLTTPAWRLSDAELSQLPPRFRWRVIAFDESGQEWATSPWVLATRP